MKRCFILRRYQTGMRRRLIQTLATAALSVAYLSAQTAITPGTPPTPAQQAANLVARLTTLLTLSAQQQAEATTIFTAEATTIAGIETNLQTVHDALLTAIQKNDQSSISADATQIG